MRHNKYFAYAIQTLAILVGLAAGVGVTELLVHAPMRAQPPPSTVIPLPGSVPEPAAPSSPPAAVPRPIPDADPAVPQPYDFRPPAQSARINSNAKEQEATQPTGIVEGENESKPKATKTPPLTPTPTPKAQPDRHEVTKPQPEPSLNIFEQASKILGELPNAENITIEWDTKILGNHLGAVEPLAFPDTIMLNSQRLAANPKLLKSVILHEVAHLYQANLAKTMGTYFQDLELSGHLQPVWGDNGLEKLADCVAIAMGATWTGYTQNCSGPGKQEWVEAVLTNTPPDTTKRHK